MTRSNVRLFYTFKNPKLNPINDPLKYQQKVQGTRCPTLLYYVNLFLVMYIMFKNLKYIKQFLISNFVRTICAIYSILLNEFTIIIIVLIFFYSRDPINLVDCFQRQSTLYLTETPGKFMIDEKNQGRCHFFLDIKR